MRAHPVVLSMLTIGLAGCAEGSGLGTDSGDAPDGFILVSTSTSGNSSDPDGYRLSVDGVAQGDSVQATGTLALALAPGRHAVRLLGVAPQCRAVSDTVVQVDVASRDTMPVPFAIQCWASGVLVTVSTTGQDPDTNGYGLLVDGAEQARLRSSDRSLILLEPGAHTIGLTDLAATCTADPASRLVTVEGSQVTPVAFAVTCAAVGVVGILIQESGPLFYLGFRPLLDGSPLAPDTAFAPGEPLSILPGERHYLNGVSPGEHRVSLAGSSLCSNQSGSQSVTIAADGSKPDTVNLTFSVACLVPQGDVATLRISATTTGSTPPATQYAVRFSVAGYWDYGFGPSIPLSAIEPDGTRFIQVPASDFGGGALYWYWFDLDGVPASCTARAPAAPNPMGFALAAGDTLDLAFTVACPG